MKNRIGIIIFIWLIEIFSVYTLRAQHLPHYTQYMYNMHIINPAYAGARADLSVGLLSRFQWVGVEGAPKTSTLALNGRVMDGLALGFSAVRDELGLFDETNINLDVSYTLVISRYDRLSMGLKGGMSWYNNHLSQGITPDNETYPDISGSSTQIGFGAYYYNEVFFGGISVPSLLNTSKFGVIDSHSRPGDINVFMTGGAVFDISGDVRFKPSTMIKYVYGVPLSIDVNANFLYNEKFEFGLSYRHKDSFSGLIAFILDKKFRIGYTYDYTFTDLGTGYGDSHELMLLYDLNLERRGRWLKNSSCYF